MTLPDIDALATVGGALQDYSTVIDPTTDRPAAGANQAYADAVAATHTGTRAWVRMTLNGSAVPVLVAHDSVWGNALAVVPVLARTSAGIYTITWPATVYDEIPSGFPGYNSPHTLNLRDGWANVHGSTFYNRQVDITSANVATVYISAATSGTLSDPSGATNVAVFVI